MKDDEDAIYGKSRERENKKTRKTLASENAQALKKSQAEHQSILERAYSTKKIKEVVDEAQQDKRKRTSRKRMSSSKDQSNPEAQMMEGAEDEEDHSDKKKKKKNLQQVTLEYSISKCS